MQARSTSHQCTVLTADCTQWPGASCSLHHGAFIKRSIRLLEDSKHDKLDERAEVYLHEKALVSGSLLIGLPHTSDPAYRADFTSFVILDKSPYQTLFVMTISSILAPGSSLLPFLTYQPPYQEAVTGVINQRVLGQSNYICDTVRAPLLSDEIHLLRLDAVLATLGDVSAKSFRS